MNSNPHRTNSDFQLRYFLAGSCKTPDGAWCLLYAQKVKQEHVVRALESQKLRQQVKEMEVALILKNDNASEIDKLTAKADLLEMHAALPTWEMNAEAAVNELNTINRLMAELEPLRKYSHLPVLEANEATQREEWLGELIERAENFIITQGSIPHDHLATMRSHPDFNSKIVPFIGDLNVKLQQIKSTKEGFCLLTQTEVFNQLT